MKKAGMMLVLLLFGGGVLMAQDNSLVSTQKTDVFSMPQEVKKKKYFEEFFMVTYEYSPFAPCMLKFGGGRQWGGTFNFDVINHNEVSKHYKDIPMHSSSTVLGFGGSAFYSFFEDLHLSLGPSYLFCPSGASSSDDGMGVYNGWKVQSSLIYSIKGFIVTGGANLLMSKYHDPLVTWSLGIGFKVGAFRF